MKDSKVLRKVRNILESRQSKFICISIDMVSAPVRQKNRLKAWIAKMLEGKLTYNSWLIYKHSNQYAQMIRTVDSFYHGRLAWLDWMIDYCEKEEANEQRSKT